MADQLVSNLPALNGADVDPADLLYIVDSSAGVAGSKKITIGQYQLAPVVAATVNGVAYFDASKVLSSNAGLTYDGTTLSSTGGYSGPAALTGTPTAPTATSGTNTTQVATTAFVQTAATSIVQAAVQALHPVGSVYINATNNTNPGTLLGFGTWVAFGAGRVPVGFDAGNALFDTAEETGGSADAIAVAHTHTFSASATTGSAGDHNHTVTYPVYSGSGSSASLFPADSTTSDTRNTSTAGAHTHSVSMSGTTGSTGSSGTNANYQPYITVYMWKRTA